MTDTSPTQLRTTADVADAPPEVTVVVPTRHEAENVRPLIERVHAAFAGMPGEIVFVDDSDDDTASAIAVTAETFPGEVHLMHRPAGQRAGGLGGAVVAGLDAARAPWVVVMDGDLQHPPEMVPMLLAAGEVDSVDTVVASRYGTRGRADGLGGPLRHAASRASGLLAKGFFPLRLRAVTDPMSGFFAVRRDAVRTAELRPDGYKILLELLVRNRIEAVAEVPYVFQPRTAGNSKASLREGLRYIRHLAVLRLATMRRPRSALARMAGFALAGAAGTGVNSAALWGLRELAGLPYLLAAFLAVQVAIVWNFAVIDQLVMPHGRRRLRHRFGRFLVLANSLTPVHLGLLYACVRWGGLHYLAANLLAIVAVFALRYAVTSYWVYGTPAGGPAAGRLMWTVRRSPLTRLALALLLTSVAFPALVAVTWNGFWTRGAAVPLLIPLAAATALAAGRLRPDPGEPDVHDRQVDVLLAGAFFVAAGALLLVAPDPAPVTWLLPSSLAYLAGAGVLLLGTRTAVRLRWTLLLPLAAMGTATSWTLPETTSALLASAVAAVGPPAGLASSADGLTTGSAGTTLVLPVQALPSPSLLAGAACLFLSALIVFGPRRTALLRATGASVVLAVLAVGSVLAVLLVGRFFGVEAFRTAQLPVITDVLLGIVVAVFVAAWSPVGPAVGPAARRQYLPRARFALITLITAALLLGLRALPELAWHPAPATAAIW